MVLVAWLQMAVTVTSMDNDATYRKAALAALAELQSYLQACASELHDPWSEPEASNRVLADLQPLVDALHLHVAASGCTAEGADRPDRS